ELAGVPKFSIDVDIGPHRAADEAAPYRYVLNLATENPRVLYNPAIGHRREAEVNDGTWQAKVYPFDWEGPDLFVKVNVPEGAYRVSLYFHNNDAATRQN